MKSFPLFKRFYLKKKAWHSSALDLARSLLWMATLSAGRPFFIFKKNKLAKVKPDKPLFPALLSYADGQEKCVGCKLCVAACPTQAITLTALQFGQEKPYADNFDVALDLCISCGLCAEACPVDALTLVPPSFTAPLGSTPVVYNKDELLRRGRGLGASSP